MVHAKKYTPFSSGLLDTQIRLGLYRYTTNKRTAYPFGHQGAIWRRKRVSFLKPRAARSVHGAQRGRRGAFWYVCVNREPDIRFPCQARVGESPAYSSPRTFAKGHSQHFSWALAPYGATIFAYIHRVACCPPGRAEGRNRASNGLSFREKRRAACFARCRRAIAVVPPVRSRYFLGALTSQNCTRTMHRGRRGIATSGSVARATCDFS